MARCILILLLGLGSIHAQILGPFAASVNHSDDIQGTPDTRPGQWGEQGVNYHQFVFNPPQGYVTRILRVYGNWQGFIRIPGKVGACAGVLWGLTSHYPDWALRMDPADNSTFLYIQDSTCGQPFKDMIDFDTHVNGLLLDNILVSKAAVFLNETGRPIHTEPSFTVVYQFEALPIN